KWLLTASMASTGEVTTCYKRRSFRGRGHAGQPYQAAFHGKSRAGMPGNREETTQKGVRCQHWAGMASSTDGDMGCLAKPQFRSRLGSHLCVYCAVRTCGLSQT